MKQLFLRISAFLTPKPFNIAISWLLFLNLPLLAPQAPEMVIVLAPFADPKNPGRTINNTFERGVALQFAEHLSTELITLMPNAQVVIIKPEEQHTHVQAASFINRLQPTLVCAFSFYQENSPQPQISLYRYLHESDLPLQRTELALYPYEQAHRLYCTESKELLQKLFDSLRTNTGLHCDTPHALPITPLLGIAAPACSIEMGLPKDYDWQALVEPLATGIAHALTH